MTNIILSNKREESIEELIKPLFEAGFVIDWIDDHTFDAVICKPERIVDYKSINQLTLYINQEFFNQKLINLDNLNDREFCIKYFIDNIQIQYDWEECSYQVNPFLPADKFILGQSIVINFK